MKSRALQTVKAFSVCMTDMEVNNSTLLQKRNRLFIVLVLTIGSQVSKYTEDTLVDILKDLPSFKKQDYKTAFQDVYRKID